LFCLIDALYSTIKTDRFIGIEIGILFVAINHV